jgi:maleate cis-trans isomerase
MAFSSWRGTVGMVIPTMRPGTIEEFIRILPEGISILPLFNNIRRGTKDELLSVLDVFEEKIKDLAEVGVDVIHPAGAPPFMVHGYAGEREIIRRWEAKYKIPMFTTGQNDCEALLALGVKRFVGVSYFTEDLNAMFAQYMRDAGFDCLGISGIGVQFDKMQELASTEVYRHVRTTFLKNPDAKGIYLLGAWRAMDMIERMEQDFQVPVVLSVAAQSWGVQHRLHIRQPREGLGRLLREMPGYKPLPAPAAV